MIILDRFEGNYAIIEIDGEISDVEQHLIDKRAKEGDVLTVIDGIYYKDNQATKKRKKDLADKFKDMWED